MTSDLCSCGYAYFESRELNPPPNLSRRCTNPWHPDLPGRCPKCGEKGVHRVITIGTAKNSTVKCWNCSHAWKPTPDA